MTASKFLLSLTAAATLTLSAFGVQAQSPAPQHADKPRVSHAQRAEDLKQKLNLAPNQLAAWDRYQAAQRPAGGHAPRGERGDGQARGERMERPQLSEAQKAEMRQRMASQRQARDSARQAFYAQLTPAQQQVFDAETRRPARKPNEARPNK